jgi:branched-chain amino acid transport system ATP-binding protein
MLLAAHDLEVRYGRVRAVRGLSLELARGEVVAVLGANGAGKSSLLRALLGIERVAAGHIEFDGIDMTDWPVSRRVQRGLVLVPVGRKIINTLTVHENLLMGAFNRRLTAAVTREIDEIYQRFSNLAVRRDSAAAVLSGGEQQMLAIGRGLLAAPKLMMLDEPSLGLSPRLAQEVFSYIGSLSRDKDITILLVEQNTSRALELADRAYVIELGRVVGAGDPKTLLKDGTLLAAYLGRPGALSSQEKPVASCMAADPAQQCKGERISK